MPDSNGNTRVAEQPGPKVMDTYEDVVLGELYLRVLLRRDGPEDEEAIESVQETLAIDYAGQQAYREPFMNAMEGLHTRFLQEAGTL